MARRVTGITDDPYQIHTVIAGDIEARVELRFFGQLGQWFITVEQGGRRVPNMRLVLGVPVLESCNLPIAFAVRDITDLGLDPARIDDFATGRCELIMLEPDDLEEIRGAPVPLRT